MNDDKSEVSDRDSEVESLDKDEGFGNGSDATPVDKDEDEPSPIQVKDFAHSQDKGLTSKRKPPNLRLEHSRVSRQDLDRLSATMQESASKGSAFSHISLRKSRDPQGSPPYSSPPYSSPDSPTLRLSKAMLDTPRRPSGSMTARSDTAVLLRRDLTETYDRGPATAFPLGKVWYPTTPNRSPTSPQPNSPHSLEVQRLNQEIRKVEIEKILLQQRTMSQELEIRRLEHRSSIQVLLAHNSTQKDQVKPTWKVDVDGIRTAPLYSEPPKIHLESAVELLIARAALNTLVADFESVIKLSSKAILLAEKLSFPPLTSRCHFIRGVGFYRSQYFTDALEEFWLAYGQCSNYGISNELIMEWCVGCCTALNQSLSIPPEVRVGNPSGTPLAATRFETPFLARKIWGSPSSKGLMNLTSRPVSSDSKWTADSKPSNRREIFRNTNPFTTTEATTSHVRSVSLFDELEREASRVYSDSSGANGSTGSPYTTSSTASPRSSARSGSSSGVQSIGDMGFAPVRSRAVTQDVPVRRTSIHFSLPSELRLRARSSAHDSARALNGGGIFSDRAKEDEGD